MILEEIIINDRKINTDVECIALKAFVSNPEIEYSELSIDGSDETIILGEKFKNREVELEFVVPKEQEAEFNSYLLLNKRFELSTNKFSERFLRCKVESVETVRVGNMMSKFSIKALTISPFFYSKKSTVKSFSVPGFVLKCDSETAIEPAVDELEIEISAAGTTMLLNNSSAGDAFEYNEANGFDYYNKIKISGPLMTRDGVNIFSETNRSLIRLFPGDNSFWCSGADFREIKFTYREKFLTGGDESD